MAHKVLLVDDEPDIIDVIRELIQLEEYEVLTATSAAAALEILNGNTVDVVISDEQMPGMCGTEFLGIVRATYPDTMRILMTGHASLDMAIRAINDGEIFRFFTKPCNFQELLVTVKQALKQKELVTESRRLLSAYKQQAAKIKQLEKRFPGMTQLDKTSTGSIIIDDTPEDFDGFFQELKNQVAGADK